MGQVTIQKYSTPPVRSRNTKDEYDKEILEERYNYILSGLSKVKISDEHVVYVFGAGGHPKSTYSELKKIQGVMVIWSASLLPRLLMPLSMFVATYAGIVSIIERDRLTEVFNAVVKLSMASLYVFNKAVETEFIDVVKRSKDIRTINEFIKESDSGYFIYQVDADNPESSTGIYEIVSYGIHCPKEYTSVLTLS